MTGQESKIGKIKELIASGYLNEALDNFKEIVDEKSKDNPTSEKFQELQNSTILLHSKYNTLKKGEINGKFEPQYIDMEKTKISNSLIKMTQEIKENTLVLDNVNNQIIKEISDDNKVHTQIKAKTVVLEIDADFNKYSEEDAKKLLNAIELLLRMDNNIEIKKMKKGSVIISIEIPENKYESLLLLLKKGYLEEFNVVKIDKHEKIDKPKKKKNVIVRSSTSRSRSSFRTTNLFIAKLNFDTTENDIRRAFEVYGEVSMVKIIMDKFTGRSKGFGFVEMDDVEGADLAIEGLNDSELDGRIIVVKRAEPRNRGGGRDGGRDFGGGDYNSGKN